MRCECLRRAAPRCGCGRVAVRRGAVVQAALWPAALELKSVRDLCLRFA